MYLSGMENSKNNTTIKILGFTDAHTTCECGKQNLKGVYVVETELGDILNLGSSCVKKDWGLTQKEFTSKVNESKALILEAKKEYLKLFNDNFSFIANKYPTVNKYTPNENGYNEFIKAKKELDLAQKNAETKYKF